MTEISGFCPDIRIFYSPSPEYPVAYIGMNGVANFGVITL